jgi:tyrosyl-tRNA synthetase
LTGLPALAKNPSAMTDNAFDVLRERGFVQQVTDLEAVRALFAPGAPPVVAYCGYDPTADSLHVGHLFTLMALKHLERHGHAPIVVLGGGTAMVGDPSGKTELRQMLEGERIQANRKRIEAQVGTLLNLHGRTRCVDNAEWLLELRYVDFLRDIGRHFSVNRMLAAEAYKLRLERGLSFIEFNYQILQAYDFLELYRRHRCVLQMGGDDQWGNILAGVDLIRRLEGVTTHGLTFPLQLTATGEKMGKTAAGAVWLDPEKLSAYDYYQYWVNTHDADVVKMLSFFTFLPIDEVTAVGSIGGAELNAAKAILAFEATLLVHGREAALSAHAAAQAAFGGRSLPAGVLPTSSVPREARADLSQMPTFELTAEQAAEGVTAAVLAVQTQLSASMRQARTSLAQGALKLDGQVLEEKYAFEKLPAASFDKPVILQLGKKKVVVKKP